MMKIVDDLQWSKKLKGARYVEVGPIGKVGVGDKGCETKNVDEVRLVTTADVTSHIWR
jgi:hypothetical protein